MSLDKKRRAMKHLLDGTSPIDAAAVYYAFHHPDDKTQLFTYPTISNQANGYICLARTGLDLFRPLATMRFPESGDLVGYDVSEAKELIFQAIPEGAEVILSTPLSYRPLITAVFELETEQQLKLLVLDRGRFQPIINVLVTRTQSYDGLPRFVIKQSSDGRSGLSGDVVASAGLNWQSQQFAEIYVHTNAPHRRQGFGQSVVAACVQYVLESGRIPIYEVASNNESSIQLAESVGFVAIGADQVLIEGRRRSLL
jgi:ribosomal protein S18 acetylase RimI-like enzyme